MSSYINKSDFFAAITGEPVEWDCPGVGKVLVRGLDIVESNRLNTKHAGDGVAIMLGAIQIGLVEPKLDEADIEALQHGRPGVVNQIGEKILVLSGLKQDDD